MPVGIKISIDNYVKADRYRINIYKQGGIIPIQSADVQAGGDPIVYFEGLNSNTMYESEVIHYCNEDSTSPVKQTVRKTVLIASTPGCNCPSGWTPTVDGKNCVRTLTQAPTQQSVNLTVAAGPNLGAYNREGIKVYAPGYSNTGQGGTLYASGPGHTYWASGNVTNRGRLNIAGVWNAASTILPTNKWIGFSSKVVTTIKKVYYIAMSGDDYIRIKINGVPIVDQRLVGGPSNANFNYLHAYPVQLNAGDNLIEMEGWNDGSEGCFVAEIYDCDLLALQNVTPFTENTLNRIFSTVDMIGQQFTDGITCANGYALDLSAPGSPVCKKIEYTACT